MVDNFHTNEGICFPLTTQYSSNATIFEWPNNVFYFGRIRTGQSVANQLISDRLTSDIAFEMPQKSVIILTLFISLLARGIVDSRVKCRKDQGFMT